MKKKVFPYCCLAEPIFLLLICCCSLTAGAADSTAISRPDSVQRVVPLPLVGGFELPGDSSRGITAAQIAFLEYRTVADLLERKEGFFIRSMGSVGQHDQLAFSGIDEKGISVMVDGISRTDPILGGYDMALFPVDDIERIEIITGPRSLFYDMNSAGGTINIVSKSYYTNKPYSRLRYSQGVNEYAQTDAIFSQNIFRKTNFSFGLSRLALGSNRIDQNFPGRFANSIEDAWSFRTKFRYNASNTLNFILSQMYHQAWTGLNGGIDVYRTHPSQLFNEIGAVVNNYDAFEKLFNHHLDLTASGFFFGDSSQLSTASFFFSNQLREYRDGENRFKSNFIFKQSDHRSSVRGILLRHRWDHPLHQLMATVKAERIDIESSPEIGGLSSWHLGGSVKEEFTVAAGLTAAMFGRIDLYRERTIPAFGTDMRWNVTSDFIVRGGAAQIDRAPTLQEELWTDDSLSRPVSRLFLKSENHSLAEIGAEYTPSSLLGIKGTFSRRIIRSPISADTIMAANSAGTYYSLLKFQQGSTVTIDAAILSAIVSIRRFTAEGSASFLLYPEYMRDGTALTIYPSMTLDGSLYYKNELFRGNLILKTGFRGRLWTKQNGMTPVQESWVFVPNPVISFGPSGVADFFLIAYLGNAYLHFVWENISANQYFVTPVYPMYGSNVRFGVSWEFLD